MARLKILSIGLELDGSSYESYGFADAPSLSDYDAVVVDLETVSELAFQARKGGQPLDRSGLPIVPTGNGNKAGEVSITEFLHRRKSEADTLMQNGGVLICFAYPSVSHVINQRAWFIYDWLPSNATGEYQPPNIVSGDGEIGKIESSHPFARYFSAFKDRLRYRVFFNRRFLANQPNLKIIARARSGEPVAVEINPKSSLPGRLIFLPPIPDIDDDEIRKIAGVIQDCIVVGIDVDNSDTAPEWVEHLEMPGLGKLDDVVAKIRQNIQKSESELAQAEKSRDEIARYRRLLWATGKHQLEPIVRNALSLLGFKVVEEGDRDAVLFAEGEKLAIAEIEGSTGAVDVDKYRQLLDYVQDEFLQSGKLLKGILIGNGYRLLAPEVRDVQFTERCQQGAEQQQYCLLDTTQLFEATKTILSDSSKEMKSHIRNQILNTTGIFTFSKPD